LPAVLWDSSFFYSKNENELLELIDDLETFTYMSTNSGNLSLRAQVGGTIGDIYGNVVEMENGQMKLREDGRPTGSTPDKYLGTAQPDFLAGWTNTIRYGNYSLRFQIDGRFGGQFYSNTSANLDSSGVSERSLQYRDGVTLEGINSGSNSANTTEITGQEYWGSMSGIAENYIYDQDNIRLRELSIGYQIPDTQSLGIQSATIQLIGRNLFFFSKDAPDVDPEMTLATQIGGQGISLNNLPSLRSLGLNLTLNF
jgi:hypothetical protein